MPRGWPASPVRMIPSMRRDAGVARAGVAGLLLASLAFSGGCQLFRSRAPEPETPRAFGATMVPTDEASPAPVVAAGEVGMLDGATGDDSPGLPVNLRQFTFGFEGADFDPSVSPDGKHVYFSSTQHSERPDIYRKPSDGRTIVRLTNHPGQDIMPAVSPDGTRIAFCSDRQGTWNIYVMSASGGQAVQITSDAANDLYPSWSPDGEHLVFSRRGLTTGQWELWVTSVSNQSSLTFIGYGFNPEWCPTPGTGWDGADRIVFQRSRSRGSRTFAIWTIDFDPAAGLARNETQIADNPSEALINPSWSPDGSHIVFASVPNPGTDEFNGRPSRASLWMSGVDGSGVVPLTGGDSIDVMPTWGRDRVVYFVSNRGGRDNIWSIDMGPALLAVGGGSGPGAPGRGSEYASEPTDLPTLRPLGDVSGR